MSKMKFLLFASLFSVFLTACGHKPMLRGKYVRQDQLEQIKIKEHHKSDIEEMLGTPTSMSAFDESVWYYISEVTKNRVYSKPRILTSYVLEIKFDELGYVDSIKTYDNNDLKDITPLKKHTKTAGHDMSAFERLANYARRAPAEGGKK